MASWDDSDCPSLGEVLRSRLRQARRNILPPEPVQDWPEYAARVETDTNVDDPAYFDCTAEEARDVA